MKRILTLISSFLLLVSLTATSVFAENSTPDKIQRFQKIKTTIEKIPQKNGGTLVFTRTDYKGTERDLTNLVEMLNKEGHSIIPISSQQNNNLSPQAIGFNSGHFSGSDCEHNVSDEIWMCSYPNFNIAARAGGLGGLAIWGSNLSTITRDTGGTATNMSAKPRLQVIGYGLTGKDSFFVGTYDYSSSDTGTLVDWNFDIISSGVIVYAEFKAGGDFSYKIYGASKSKTVWVPLTKD